MWKKVAALVIHKGLVEAFKYYASQTENKWDDLAAEGLDRVVDAIIPLEEEE